MSPVIPTELQELISSAKVTASFVVDGSGSSIGPGGNSSGLGNKTDLALLRYIRSEAEIVLTSGRTARADSISMPKTADLAIFTAAGVESLALHPSDNQKLFVFGPERAKSFPEALEVVRGFGYQEIQLEFGETGFASVLDEINLCVVSGKSASGVRLFLQRHTIRQTDWFELEDLFVAVGAGRGKA